MDVELLAIILGTIHPLYPALFAIFEKIYRFDVMYKEFHAFRDEHERKKEKYHGN
ncbi:MAG: hypothetical protein STSR0009_13270 [Methanoregula sp.]